MRKAPLTNSFAKGVLDPHLSERVDLTHYYASLAEAENVLVAPQGSIADRGGTMLVSDADVLASGIDRRLRRVLEPIAVTAAMITAGNGGTAANAVDQNASTFLVTNVVATTPFAILEVDLGVPTTVAAFDVIGVAAGIVGINETLAVEWFNAVAGVWVAFGGSADNAGRKHIRTSQRTRRFAGWPGSAVTARNWRVVLHGAAGAGAVSLTGIRLWSEGQALSSCRLFTMARSASEVYDCVLTDRNIDVFRGMRWQAAIPVPIASQQIDTVAIEGSLDTLLLFHEDVPTQRIVRQGSDGEWDASGVPWTNIPWLNVTTSFSGAQDEIHQVALGTVVPGQAIVLVLGDLFAAPLIYADDVSFAAAARAALAGLTGAALSNVLVDIVAAQTFRVSYVNANGARAWPLTSVKVIGTAADPPPTVIVQRGLNADVGAPLIGDKMGWPRCGAFVQSRLLIAGFRAAPTSYAVSVVASYYDFLQLADPPLASASMVRALDVDEIETIQHVFVGRHVQLFTDSGEWFIETRSFDATQPLNLVLATRNGAAAGVAPVFADGSTLFVQAGGKTLRDMALTDTETSYKTDPMSVLGPHLLTDVRDLAHRQARSVREGNQLVMVNADGTIALLTLLRQQDVVAISPWSTPYGFFRRAAADMNQNLRFIVERDGVHRLETWTPEMPLDCATRYAPAVPSAICAGLPFPDGREVWAYADDELVGPLTVTAGAVTLPAPAAVAIVGLAPPFRARLPVVRGKPTEAPAFRPPMRIFEVDLALDRTGAITIAVNGGAHAPVPLMRTDAQHRRGGPLQTATGGQADLPMLQRLYTGSRRIQGLTGWTEHAFVELSRDVPAPVRVKSVRMEIAHHG